MTPSRSWPACYRWSFKSRASHFYSISAYVIITSTSLGCIFSLYSHCTKIVKCRLIQRAPQHAGLILCIYFLFSGYAGVGVSAPTERSQLHHVDGTDRAEGILGCTDGLNRGYIVSWPLPVPPCLFLALFPPLLMLHGIFPSCQCNATPQQKLAFAFCVCMPRLLWLFHWPYYWICTWCFPESPWPQAMPRGIGTHAVGGLRRSILRTRTFLLTPSTPWLAFNYRIRAAWTAGSEAQLRAANKHADLEKGMPLHKGPGGFKGRCIEERLAELKALAASLPSALAVFVCHELGWVLAFPYETAAQLQTSLSPDLY